MNILQSIHPNRSHNMKLELRTCKRRDNGRGDFLARSNMLPVMADIVKKGDALRTPDLLGCERKGGGAGPGREITVVALVGAGFCQYKLDVFFSLAIFIDLPFARDY